MIQIKQTNNKALAEEIKNKIKLNKGHCACSIIPTDDNKCMCKEFRERIERHEPGQCHCGLYEIIITED
jgi:hypothetical protein